MEYNFNHISPFRCHITLLRNSCHKHSRFSWAHIVHRSIYLRVHARLVRNSIHPYLISPYKRDTYTSVPSDSLLSFSPAMSKHPVKGIDHWPAVPKTIFFFLKRSCYVNFINYYVIRGIGKYVVSNEYIGSFNFLSIQINVWNKKRKDLWLILELKE